MRGSAPRRRPVSRVDSLGVLGLNQAVMELRALLAPPLFFDSFPAAGPVRVALLPPDNEHLARDVGALSCALLMVLAGLALAVT